MLHVRTKITKPYIISNARHRWQETLSITRDFTPRLDWVKKFTRSCSMLTGKRDTTMCSQRLFQVPKAQRCSSGTGLSKRLQPTPATPVVTLPVPDLPVPVSPSLLLSQHQRTALHRHGEVQHCGERPRSFPGAPGQERATRPCWCAGSPLLFPR